MIHIPSLVIGLFAAWMVGALLNGIKEWGYEEGLDKGRELEEEFIHLKIRQRAYILDGKRVMLLKDRRKKRRG